jgi:hypothetical protein
MKGTLNDEIIYEDAEYQIRRFDIISPNNEILNSSWIILDKVLDKLNNVFNKPDELIRNQKIKKII